MRKENDILQHTVKALEYRFKKAVMGSKADFGTFTLGEYTRTPNEIVNHMFDLIIKTKTIICEGHLNSPTPTSLKFRDEVERFLAGLRELQHLMISAELDIEISKKILQGPILDIATHIGQISMLNGLNGNRISKENYYAANLEKENL